MMANTAKIKQGEKKFPCIEQVYIETTQNVNKFNDEHICNKGPKPNFIVNQ